MPKLITLAFGVPLASGMPAIAAVQTFIGRRLRMAVRAKQTEITGKVVIRIAVLVLQLKDNRTSVPFANAAARARIPVAMRNCSSQRLVGTKRSLITSQKSFVALTELVIALALIGAEFIEVRRSRFLFFAALQTQEKHGALVRNRTLFVGLQNRCIAINASRAEIVASKSPLGATGFDARQG